MLETTLLIVIHCNTTFSNPVDQTQPLAMSWSVLTMERFLVANNVGKRSTVHLHAGKRIVVDIVKHVFFYLQILKMMVHNFRERER